MSDKPKCPVFGCTIPRGIPHEHPAGVSAVMRDPVEPLNADDRAELERYRAAAEKDLDEDAKRLRENLLSQARGMQHVGPGSQVYDRAMGTNYYLKPAEVPTVPGRKLRDSLLMAGNIPRTESTSFNVPGGGSVTVDTTFRSSDTEWSEVRRLSVAQIAGRIATGIVLFIGVAAIVILSAMNAGWL